MIEPGVQAFRVVQAVTQRASEGRQFQIVSPEEVEKFPPTRLAETFWREISDGVHLNAADPQSFRFAECPAERQSHRFQSHADFHLVRLRKRTADDAAKSGDKVFSRVLATVRHWRPIPSDHSSLFSAALCVLCG